jgi:histidinol dehydrogenase
LLSQAEHGIDSQVVLVTDSPDLPQLVWNEIEKQSVDLPRKEFIEECLKNSFALIVESIKEAIEFSNGYAPEHLLINCAGAESYIDKIINAGSVFVGPYSPESAGDYASGTNHSLPTYGYAKAIGGVSVEMFMKGMTIQNLSKEGLKNISGTVVELAETEQLKAHANAIRVRFK